MNPMIAIVPVAQDKWLEGSATSKELPIPMILMMHYVLIAQDKCPRGFAAPRVL